MSTEEKITDNVDVSDVDQTALPYEDYVIDPKFERKVLRKIDFNLILVFGLLYMMSFLDRSAIGNANLTGFSTDLGLVGNQYGAAVSLVYATYVTFEPVWTVSLKMLTPRYVLTATTLIWSIITIGSAFIKNFDQLVAIRVLLGIFEAGISPCISLYLTMTYNRNEYVTRQTFIFCCSALSGAFGGLLAYGLSDITAHGLHGWQWLFLVEGLISVALVPLAYWRIPNSIDQASWLNEDEKFLLRVRRARNSGVYNEAEEFSWASLKAAASDYRLWIHACMHFGIDATLYSLTTFLPTLISGLGFSSKVEAQLLTVPVYVTAALSFVIVGPFSDKTQMRGPFIIFGAACCLIGYIILAACNSVGGRYAAVYIASMGLYTTTAIHILWVADNFAGHYKRALSMGIVQLVGNSAGACMGFVFTTQTAPRYYNGLIFDSCFTAFVIVCATVLCLLYRHRNIKNAKAVENGAPNDPSLGDKNPHYVFFM